MSTIQWKPGRLPVPGFGPAYARSIRSSSTLRTSAPTVPTQASPDSGMATKDRQAGRKGIRGQTRRQSGQGCDAAHRQRRGGKAVSHTARVRARKNASMSGLQAPHQTGSECSAKDAIYNAAGILTKREPAAATSAYPADEHTQRRPAQANHAGDSRKPRDEDG